MEANGIPIMALVDSGSTISMIHPSVLDRIQRGHDVTLVGDMGQLRVEDGRTVETHGVVQLSFRVGTDPSPVLHEMVGDMGQLCVEDGRTVETHGVVQLSLRVGTDPSPVLHEMVGDMGQLCVEDGRTVETHGVVQLSLRFGTDPSPVLHEMVVAEMEAPAIVGIDFMMVNHCILDAPRGTLIFNGRTHHGRVVQRMLKTPYACIL